MVSLDGRLLRIGMREPRRELAISLRRLRRARELVVSDPDIMGAEPVFRGTCVPDLPPEMIDLAPVYAAARASQSQRLRTFRATTPPPGVVYQPAATPATNDTIGCSVLSHSNSRGGGITDAVPPASNKSRMVAAKAAGESAIATPGRPA